MPESYPSESLESVSQADDSIEEVLFADVGESASLAPESAPSPRRLIDWRGILIALLLVGVLAAGAYFRFVGQNWDDFTHLHPDERFLTGVVSSLSPVDSIGDYFDTHTSSLNPNNRGAGFYVYGTLPLFIVKGVSEVVADLTNNISWTGYNGAHLVGRTVSAVADLLTVFFVFLLGRRLYNRWTGLLAAALYAWAVLPIQLSHFWTMDAPSTLPVVIAFWFAVRVLDDGGWRNYGGFGLAFGAAVASRINVVPLAVVVALAALSRMMPLFEASYPALKRQRLISREGGGLVFAGLISMLAFRVAQPYAFDGPGFFGILPNMDWWAQMKEVSRQVSGQVDFPPNHQWASRIPYLFSWQNMVLWGMGVPLGLTAWIAWAYAGLQVLRGKANWLRHLLPVVWIALYFAWQGGGWVMSMRYYMPLYPFLILLAAWALVSLVQHAYRAYSERPDTVARLRFGSAVALLVLVTGFTLVWAVGFTHIYNRQLTRVQASHWILQNVPADYSIVVEAEDGSSRLINLALPNDNITSDSELVQHASRYFDDGEMRSVRFTSPLTGTVASVHAEYLGDPFRDEEPETLWVGLWDVAGAHLLSEGTLTAEFSEGESLLGQSYDIALEEPVSLETGRLYELQTSALEGAPFTVAGAVIATEGPWDDPIPWKVCGMPDNREWTPDTPPGTSTLSECVGIDGFGMGYYQGLELFMASEDNDQKRDNMIEVLNNTDYLTISSNRFYDSLSRLPMRFPMTMQYYDALFGGELGFELVQTFESTFTIGPWKISDQVLPTYNSPDWLNEFEAEEAFHVYDHPVVFVFRKTDDYDSRSVARFFTEIELTANNDPFVWSDGSKTVGVIQWNALQASEASTALMLPDDMREVQYAGGTWSELYNTDALINRSDVAATVAWWGLIILLGLIIWPTLFALLPGLPDRGYPVAKIAGVLVVSWLAWFGASLGLHTWSQAGLTGAAVMVLALSLYLGWRRREALVAYVREYWRRMLLTELIALGMFLAFLAIRLGNPDLWHPNFGGEKPMDFAYLNAILRSTVFPPINPWFSGGYINYYYYGFVLVGTPIKLLGLVPSVGFNLIEASLFALTGIGAFSAAFNLAASWQHRRRDGSAGPRLGNPWVAGVVAMLLAVILGNLDDIRLVITALARTGGWRPVTGREFLPPISAIVTGLGNLFSGQALNFSTHWWYWNPTRVIAHTGNAITEIPFFTFLYGDPHAHAIAMPVTLLVVGWVINEVLTAAKAVQRSLLESGLGLALGALVVGLLSPTNFADYVTYLVLALFGLTLANYLWLRSNRKQDDAESGVVAELATPGARWRVAGWFGGAALYFGWQWLRNLNLTRAAALRWVGQVTALVVLSSLFIAPYKYWYATADAVPQFWQGDKTPLWGYLDLNGLFLFLIISLLVWDTLRYLRSVRVSQFVGRGALLSMALAALAWLVVISIVVALGGYVIALLALPVIFWAGLLFFRPGQVSEMRIVLALIVLTISLTFIVDVIVWAGDIGRQNTVFKFYIQVWLLLSVVGGAAFSWLLRASDNWRGWVRGLWMTVATILFTIAAMYPLLATQAKFIDRMAPDAPNTLDGAAFMPYATQGEHGEWFPLEEDYQMIRWLQENVQGTPVILEGQSEREYLWGSRVSVYTGMPTIVGYNFHQRQQHTLDPLSRVVQLRVLNVNTIYDTLDVDVAWRLLKTYEVSYIVVGQLERVYYDPAGLMKFEDMARAGLLEQVYEQGQTRVYRVVNTTTAG